MFNQKRSDNHAHPIMHNSSAPQLAHSGIDQRDIPSFHASRLRVSRDLYSKGSAKTQTGVGLSLYAENEKEGDEKTPAKQVVVRTAQ